jgi:hypothetical protein
MWLLVLGVGTADACLNEMVMAHGRFERVARAAPPAPSVSELRAAAAAALERRMLEDARFVRLEVARRERLATEARLAEEARLDAEWRTRWGTVGVALGVLGAIASAGATAWLAVRVERAGGRREVRYA